MNHSKLIPLSMPVIVLPPPQRPRPMISFPETFSGEAYRIAWKNRCVIERGNDWKPVAAQPKLK